MLPLIEGLVFGREIYDQYEVSNLLLTVFGPVLNAYHANSVIPFLVFFALFLVVVRNNKLPHFVRFNAMQSILLDICLMLAGLVRGARAREEEGSVGERAAHGRTCALMQSRLCVVARVRAFKRAHARTPAPAPAPARARATVRLCVSARARERARAHTCE